MAHRNFGVRARDTFRDFWNGPSPEHRDDPIWPICLVLGAVAVIVLVGVFVA